MTTFTILKRSTAALALAALIVPAPWNLQVDPATRTVSLQDSMALAKRGGDDDRDDKGGSRGRDDRRGKSSSRSGGDDKGGKRGSGRSDDKGSKSASRGNDDRGRDDRGRDDRADDSNGRGRGGDDHRGRGRDDANEVTLSDGSRIEIQNGRFEMKDASGRTVVERPATAADLALLGRARSEAGLATAAVASDGRSLGARDNNRGGGVVAKYEANGSSIEITYTDGWKEEIEGGRYELTDNLNRTVIQRPARPEDFDRLFSPLQ